MFSERVKVHTNEPDEKKEEEFDMANDRSEEVDYPNLFKQPQQPAVSSTAAPESVPDVTEETAVSRQRKRERPESDGTDFFLDAPGCNQTGNLGKEPVADQVKRRHRRKNNRW